MIRISLGNVGSGKTLSEVREMVLNKKNRITYSNITPTKIGMQTTLKHIRPLTAENIFIVKGEGKQKKYEVNEQFWKSIKVPINIVIDETHNLLDSRNSQSKVNRVVTSWQSAIRRILGETESGYGELVYITQLIDSIDVRSRELATQIRYHICHYMKRCKKCHTYWTENTEMPEVIDNCPRCQSYELYKSGHVVEVYKFTDIRKYMLWFMDGAETYYSHYIIPDISNYFPLYSTREWGNLFKDYY